MEATHGLIGALIKDTLFNGGKLAQAGGNQNGEKFLLPPRAN